MLKLRRAAAKRRILLTAAAEWPRRLRRRRRYIFLYFGSDRDVFIDPRPLASRNIIKIVNFVKVQLKKTKFSCTLLKLSFKQIIWTNKERKSGKI